MSRDPASEPFPELLAHAAGVRRLARTLVRDGDRAEDVAQETMARAVERPPPAGWPLHAWLAGVARHVAAGFARGERRRAERERRAARPEAVPSAADAVARVAEQRRVLDAVLALDENERVAVVLRFFEGLPPRAIAARLGVPVETVRTRLKRALARLRARLEAQHGDRRRSHFALLAISGWKPASWVVLPGLGVVAVKKVLALLVLALLLGFAGWRVLGSSSGERETPKAPEAGASPEAGLAATAPRAPPAAEAPALGPDVDLAAADRDRDLHGVVVREDGSPVAGADVRTVSYPGRRVFLLDLDAHGRAVDGPATRTSRSGEFLLRLARGERVHLVVSAPGFARAERADCLAGERVRVVLKAPTRVVVVLSDERGAPVMEGQVRLFRAPTEPDAAFDLLGKPDAKGQVVFEGVPGPTIATVEWKPETLGGREVLRISVPAAGEVRVPITVPAGRTVTGRVVDGADGTPVAGARVGMGWELARAVATDAAGRFALRGWTGRENAQVHVVADGFARTQRRVEDAEVVDFELVRGSSVKGRLVDEDGRPLARATVAAVGYASQQKGVERMSTRSGTSGEDGRFRLDGLAGDLPHALTVLAEGRGRTLVDFDPAPRGGEVVDLGDVLVPRGLRLEGRYVDADGAPKPRVRVQLVGANSDRARLRAGEPAMDTDVYGTRESGFTDDLGRFRFRDLAPGTYALIGLAPGEASVRQSVELRDADVLDVELRGAAGRSLRVLVVDDRGRPVGGVAVTLTAVDTGAWHGQARSGEDGVADFVLPRDDAALNAYTSPPPTRGGPAYFVPKSARIEPTAREARIVLAEAGRVAGRVVNEAGLGLPRREVVAKRDGKPVGSTYSDASGEFELLLPPGGPVDLAIGSYAASGGRFGPAPEVGSLRGVPADAAGLVLVGTRLPSDRRLRVLVLAPDGSPAPGVTVFSPVVWGGRWVVGPVTDASGVVEAADLTPRPGELHFSVGTESVGHLRWIAPPPDPVVPDGQTVTVRLLEAARVSGVVLAPDGTPSPRTQVTAFRGDDTVSSGMTNDAGEFTLLLDPARHLPVRLRAERHGEALVGTVEEVRGAASGLTIRLAKPD